MAVAVVIEVVPYGPMETGIWCDDCMLPSKVKQRFVLVAGMTVLGSCPSITMCEDHEVDA